MPRKVGAKNYDRSLLLSLVKDLMPKGLNDWETVALRYKNASGELEKRDAEDVRRQFIENMCNKGKKPTGKSGGQDDFTYQCQLVFNKILKVNQASALGIEDSDSEKEENNDDVVDVVDVADGEEEDDFDLKTPAALTTNQSSTNTTCCSFVSSSTPAITSDGDNASIGSIATEIPALKKRKKENDTKSKNCKVGQPRNGIGKAFERIADAYTQNSSNNALMIQIQNMNNQIQMQWMVLYQIADIYVYNASEIPKNTVKDQAALVRQAALVALSFLLEHPHAQKWPILIHEKNVD